MVLVAKHQFSGVSFADAASPAVTMSPLNTIEAPVPSDAFATIQVRAFTGARFVLKFGPNATVADLRSKIDAEVASSEPYEIRTAFPPRSYRDDGATLEAEGLVPTAVVVLQKVSAST